jgi:hypothetical protein
VPGVGTGWSISAIRRDSNGIRSAFNAQLPARYARPLRAQERLGKR